jgi:predicted alpha/beta-fold hydrolase
MPIVESHYESPLIFRNYHISTIYAAVFRKVKLQQQRERLELPEGDFLDLDWSYAQGQSKKLLILLHGLEGSAQRPYMTGTAKLFNQNGWDVVAVNFRGCGGELNRSFRSYHAGATNDLKSVVEHVRSRYPTISLKGFSLGGNLLLKYLGEEQNLPQQIKAAVAVSVPCDLRGSLQEIQQRKNMLYEKRFLRKLKEHLLARHQKFPNKITREEIAACNDLLAVDELYTSRAHGFENALDYYTRNSSLQFLGNISIPTLIINAGNDGFLSKKCYPIDAAKANPKLYLEMPAYGGHVGFLQNKKHTYNEERALEFISSKC